MLELQKESESKEALVMEANKAIEDLTEDRHDVRAKIKHLIQVYIKQVSRSEEQSAYKGDESSLSIDDCFEQIQEALEQ